MTSLMDFDFSFNDIHSAADGPLKIGESSKVQPLQINTELSKFDFESQPGSPTPSSATSIKSSISLVQPTSSYWHIPDKANYLTSIAALESNQLCAIGSGSKQNNLFIYEVYPDGIAHHQTISLPEISTLKWAPPNSQLGQMGNVLLSGHRNGMAHLTLLPDAAARKGQSAEILKRYNHAKHLSHANNAKMPHSVRIKNLELTGSKWRCCPELSLFTLCGDHIFLWEPNRSDVPLVMQKSPATNTVGLSTSRDGIYALGRKKGVCIRDIRVRDRVNSGLKPPVSNDESVSVVKWNQFDGGNQLAAVHDRTTIKIWDIRSKSPLATYKRHMDSITGLEWSTETELVSASADGTVRVWDTSNLNNNINDSNTPKPETDTETSISTPYTEYRNRLGMEHELEGCTDDLLQKIPPINHSRQFTAMTLTSMGPSIGALTIDTSGYLGVHDLADSASFPHNGSTSSLDL